MIKNGFFPIRQFLGAVLVALPLHHAVAAQYDQRLDSLGKLIETSSGARQVEQSENALALALREEARDGYERAREAHAAGRDEEVAELLDEAANNMFRAVRMIRSPVNAEQKQSDDYQRRRQSVDALLAAQQRVSTEKGMAAEGEAVLLQVEGLVSKGDELAQRHELEGAMVLVNQAYLAIKVSLESMRGGDTLVRSLQFDSGEEEYRYELDRNDTHRMLADMVMQDNKGASGLGDMAAKLLEEAESMRKQAERQAADKQFDTAIESLEQSTKQLVRVIRSGGLYIPG